MQISGDKRQRVSPPSQPESPRNHPAAGYSAPDYYSYPYTGVPASASASPHGMTAAAHAASLVVATAAAAAAISPPGVDPSTLPDCNRCRFCLDKKRNGGTAARSYKAERRRPPHWRRLGSAPAAPRGAPGGSGWPGFPQGQPPRYTGRSAAAPGARASRLQSRRFRRRPACAFTPGTGTLRRRCVLKGEPERKRTTLGGAPPAPGAPRKVSVTPNLASATADPHLNGTVVKYLAALHTCDAASFEAVWHPEGQLLGLAADGGLLLLDSDEYKEAVAGRAPSMSEAFTQHDRVLSLTVHDGRTATAKVRLALPASAASPASPAAPAALHTELLVLLRDEACGWRIISKLQARALLP